MGVGGSLPATRVIHNVVGNHEGKGAVYCTYPHSKGPWAVREGAAELKELQVSLADVVLQVESGGEVGLAASARAQQDRLL